MQNTLTNSKGVTFVIMKNHTCASIRKERLGSTSEARREESLTEGEEDKMVRLQHKKKS